jgi:hypothetical protein
MSKISPTREEKVSLKQGCGSGSVLGIRIPDPDPGAKKLRNISVKMHFLGI